MTQKDKELLLKDLCARLPYGVKVQDELGRINKLVIGNADLIRLYYNDFSIYSEQQISLPLLRPMSSMTEEEKRTYTSLRAHAAPFTIVNWLDENHFDHRTNTEGEHLIELGIALEALEGMYK